MIDLSVIIVSWNAKKYLRKCIESIVRETNNYETEIIVVDNASEDDSAQFVRENFPHATVICNSSNLGFAKANNIGIRRSTGRYLLLINSDVEVSNGCIDRIVPYMDKRPEIGMLGPQILDSNGNIQRSCMGFPTLWNTFCRALALDALFPGARLFGGSLMTFWRHDTIRNVDVINGCFWTIRREALTQVGLLDERFFIYAEDKDWCKRFREAGWNIVYFPQAQSVHYGGASSANAPIRFYLEMHRANLQYWRKHHGRRGRIAFLFIMGLHHAIRLLAESALYVLKPRKRAGMTFNIKKRLACIQWIAGRSA